MIVVAYQLLIIVTVALAFLIGGRKPAFYLSVFWSFWTLALLFFPPLIFTQLGFTWGTYFVCRAFASNKEKIAGVNKALSEYPPDERRRIETFAANSRIDRIIGDQHRSELHAALSEARCEVIVLSGWISSRVLDAKVLGLLSNALARGVYFTFGYGWMDSKGDHLESRSAQEALKSLKALGVLYPGQICVGRFPNHQKVLIRDSEYLICGSHNWLSNNTFQNSELSVKIHSPSLASIEATRIKEIVHQDSTAEQG